MQLVRNIKNMQETIKNQEKKVLPDSRNGMICGICSLIQFWSLSNIKVTSIAAVLIAIFGLIFSIKAKKMYKNAPSKYLGSGMATAGLITSIIGLVLGLFFVYYAFLRVRF